MYQIISKHFNHFHIKCIENIEKMGMQCSLVAFQATFNQTYRKCTKSYKKVKNDNRERYVHSAFCIVYDIVFNCFVIIFCEIEKGGWQCGQQSCFRFGSWNIHKEIFWSWLIKNAEKYLKIHFWKIEENQ